jgi:hypothetical protein
LLRVSNKSWRGKNWVTFGNSETVEKILIMLVFCSSKK